MNLQIIDLFLSCECTKDMTLIEIQYGYNQTHSCEKKNRQTMVIMVKLNKYLNHL